MQTLEENYTFFRMDNAFFLLSQLPLVNDPHTPLGSPKLVNLIAEIGRSWQDNSKVLFSYAFPHALPTTTVSNFTNEGLPPNSANKTKLFSPSSRRKERGTWYLNDSKHN